MGHDAKTIVEGGGGRWQFELIAKNFKYEYSYGRRATNLCNLMSPFILPKLFKAVSNLSLETFDSIVVAVIKSVRREGNSPWRQMRWIWIPPMPETGIRAL